MTRTLPTRVVPKPTGFDDEVKARVGQAERAWEAVTGTLTFCGAGGAAAAAAGLDIAAITPFVVAIAAGSFYFRLRAKWLKEDPPRPDYETVTALQLRRLDLLAVAPPGPVLPGASIVSLLHATGSSIEATVLAVERAMGASVYAAVSDNSDALLPHQEARMREARAHAEMSEILCASLSVAAERIGEALGDGVPSRTLVAGYEARVAEGSEAISLRDLLEERDRVALGQVIASGIDPSLLEVPIDFARWSESMPPQDDGPFTAPQGWVRQTFADAGAATGELGAALGRWARDIDSRPSSQI